MPKEDVLRYSPVEESAEDESFIPFAPHRYRPQHTSERRWRFFYSKTHILALYALNLLLLALVIWGFVRPVPDPTLGVYCMSLPSCILEHHLINSVWFIAPANSAVKYIAKKKLRPALFKPTEYMGYPTPDGRTDELWSSLYNCEGRPVSFLPLTVLAVSQKEKKDTNLNGPKSASPKSPPRKPRSSTAQHSPSRARTNT